MADLFLFSYERNFIMSLTDDTQTDIIEAFSSISKYSDDLWNIHTPYFEGIVTQIYPTELQFNLTQLILRFAFIDFKRFFVFVVAFFSSKF